MVEGGCLLSTLLFLSMNAHVLNKIVFVQGIFLFLNAINE